MGETGRYIIRRLLLFIPTVIGISVIVFVAMNAVGDPLEIIKLTNPRITQESVDALKAYYGFDKPLVVQYATWLSNFLRGDLGVSISLNQPVSEVIGSWAWETAKLQLTALVIALLISIPVAVNSACHQYSKSDVTATTIALFGLSMPAFWFGGVLIIVFSFYLGWFPSQGAYGLQPWPTIFGTTPFLDELIHLVLPATVIAYLSQALFVRILRANLLEILRQDYILAQRASGLRERTLIYKYALRSAGGPLVTFVVMRIGFIFAGSPLTETVFNWPGLGYRFVLAAEVLDFPVIIGILMVITVMMIACVIALDLIHMLIDPRIRFR